MERGEAVERPGVGVRLPLQEQLGRPDVPAVGGHVEGRQVVHRHLVHGRAVVEEHARGVNVVALTVDRRKNVMIDRVPDQ